MQINSKEELIKKFDILTYHDKFRYSIIFDYLDGIKMFNTTNINIDKYIIKALYLNRHNICDYLIDENNASTILLYVAKSCSIENLKYLISKGADIFHYGIVKEISLNKNIELIKYICEKYELKQYHYDGIVRNATIYKNYNLLKYLLTSKKISCDLYYFNDVFTIKNDKLFKLFFDFYKKHIDYSKLYSYVLNKSVCYEYFYGFEYLNKFELFDFDTLLINSISDNKVGIVDYIMKNHKQTNFDISLRYVINNNLIEMINYFIKYDININITDLDNNETKKIYIEYLRKNKLKKICK